MIDKVALVLDSSSIFTHAGSSGCEWRYPCGNGVQLDRVKIASGLEYILTEPCQVESSIL